MLQLLMIAAKIYQRSGEKNSIGGANSQWIYEWSTISTPRMEKIASISNKCDAYNDGDQAEELNHSTNQESTMILRGVVEPNSQIDY